MLTRRHFLQQAALASGAALSYSLIGDKVQARARKVEPFGKATLIDGNARERGRKYGRLFAEGIKEFLDREILGAFVGKPSSKDDLLRYAGACFKVIQAECPVIADEMEGMAEATGLSIEEHVLTTLHEELYHRSALPPVPHCTAVAVGKPQTKDQAAFVGQTWDWMPSVAGMSTMLEWRRGDGPSLLAYSFPGLWVGAGLNSKGLALCWTSADLGKPGQTPRIGLPAYVILAHLLYQESFDAVREVANRNKHAGWFTFVMGDATGRLMNVEGSPESVEVVEATGRLVRIGFGSHKMTKTPSDKAVNVHPRCRTMDALLTKAAGEVDLATMQQSFADPARGIICVGRNTIDMMVYNTVHRTAHLSRGAEYGVAWKEYKFS
jgi:hypothetical protein